MRASSRIVGSAVGRSAWLVAALIAAMIAVSLPSQASELPSGTNEAPQGGDLPESDAPAPSAVPENGVDQDVAPDPPPCSTESELWVDGYLKNPTEAGTGTSVNPFTTIEAAALAAAATPLAPGGCLTIKVLPALYVMTGAAILTEGVTIKGVVDAAMRPTIPTSPATPSMDADFCGRSEPWPGLVRGTIALRGDRSGVEGLTFGPPVGHWSALAAIVVEYPDHASIRCNVIDHRSPIVKFIGILVAGAFMPGGIDVPSDLHVAGNVISGTGTGIYLEPGSQALPNTLAGADGHIVGNRIVGNLVGLVTHTTGALEISQNEIRENLNAGASIQAWSGSSMLRRNIFSDNVGEALVAAVPMDARQNWWGSPLGPRTDTITPGELQPSSTPTPPTITTNPPSVTGAPTAESAQQTQQDVQANGQNQLAREDVSGIDVKDFDPWCSEATCAMAPVVFTGILVSGTDACRDDGTSTLVASWIDLSDLENPREVSASELAGVPDDPVNPFRYSVDVPWDLDTVTLTASQAQHLSTSLTLPKEGEPAWPPRLRMLSLRSTPSR